MSQCVSCSNQPNTNESLGGASKEGTVTPMVVGIIVGTVIVFVIVVCALFYCVKLENHRYMAKVEEEGESELAAAAPSHPGGGAGAQQQFEEQAVEGRPPAVHVREASSRELSVKSRPCSSAGGGGGGQEEGMQEVGRIAGGGGGGGGGGKKKLMFGWGKKARNSVPSADTAPVTAIEMV